MPPIAPRCHVYCRSIAVALLVFRTAVPAEAVERSCGSDPVENTATVLCAPPSGPCTDTLVVVSTNITVRNGGCDFDLGGRALRIERTIRVPGQEPDGLQGRIVFDVVADVTITRRAKLKARGDFVRPAGTIIAGGAIGVESSGRIDVFGMIDGSGEGSFGIWLLADGDVSLDRRSRVRARGISGLHNENADAAGGGDITVSSRHGGVFVDGEIDMRGGNQSYGGSIEIGASHDVEIAGTLDVSGGAEGSGTIYVVAADDVRLEGFLNATGRNGGGPGGDVTVAAGETLSPPFEPDGAKPLGDLRMLAGAIDVRGSGKLAADAGSGGSVDLSGRGTAVLAAAAVIRADGGSPLPDNVGGYVVISAGDDFGNGPPSHGDVEFAGLVSLHGGDTAGDFDLQAARDLTVDGSADLTGGRAGGSLIAVAGRNLTFGGAVSAPATHADGYAGQIRGYAGRTADGTLTITRDLRAPAGASGNCSQIRMSTCTLAVNPGVTLDASCGTADPPTDHDGVTLLARNAIDLGAGSRYLAAPAGRVALVHPPGVIPTIGAGVEFRPAVVDVEDANAPYPACGG